MFETQRFANIFEAGTSAREDASSFAQRFFSVFGEINTYFYKDLIRFKKSFFPKMSITDLISSVYEWDISNFSFQYYSDLNRNIIVPTVNGDGLELEIFTTVDSFLNCLPFDLNFDSSFTDSYIIYESLISESSAIQDIIVPNYLYIEFNNVTSFAVSGDTTISSSPNYIAKLTIEGEDYYGNEIIEYIYPTVNGVYTTLNIYSKINNLLLVNVEGSEATLTIKALDFNLLEYISNYNIVTTSEVQTPLIMDYDEDFFIIKYYIFPPQNGQRVSSDKELFGKVKLLTSSEEEISITDISFSSNREELYVLSSNKVFIFDNWINDIHFRAPQIDRTLETLMTADFMYRLSGLNETNTCYIGPSKTGKRIKDYTIYFKDPDGELLYLNNDYEFTSSLFTFLTDTSISNQSTINNFQFDFILDKLGQWDFVIESTDFENKEYVYTTSILVPSLLAAREINLDNTYTGISYHPEGFIYLFDGNVIDKYILSFNAVYIDSFNRKAYTIENYSDLELVYV